MIIFAVEENGTLGMLLDSRVFEHLGRGRPIGPIDNALPVAKDLSVDLQPDELSIARRKQARSRPFAQRRAIRCRSRANERS